VEAYEKPHDWLMETAALRPLLRRYDEWCFKVISDWRMQEP
jgi:hypothetical protein